VQRAMIPCMLHEDQCDIRVCAAGHCTSSMAEEGAHSHILTADESSMHSYDPDMKCQSAE
jgi:hypothetical protein